MKSAVEFIKDAARQRHLPDDAALATLQGSDVGDAAVEVDRCRGERQNF
jgi:hypothetical protein